MIDLKCWDERYLPVVKKNGTFDLFSTCMYFAVCLTEWTSRSELSEECVAALPVKEETTRRELTPEEKKKAAARRK